VACAAFFRHYLHWQGLFLAGLSSESYGVNGARRGRGKEDRG